MNFYNQGVFEALIKLGVIDPETERYMQYLSENARIRSGASASLSQWPTADLIASQRVANMPDPSTLHRFAPNERLERLHTAFRTMPPSADTQQLLTQAQAQRRAQEPTLKEVTKLEGAPTTTYFQSKEPLPSYLQEMERERIRRGLPKSLLPQIHGHPSMGQSSFMSETGVKPIGESAVTPPPVRKQVVPTQSIQPRITGIEKTIATPTSGGAMARLKQLLRLAPKG